MDFFRFRREMILLAESMDSNSKSLFWEIESESDTPPKV